MKRYFWIVIFLFKLFYLYFYESMMLSAESSQHKIFFDLFAQLFYCMAFQSTFEHGFVSSSSVTPHRFSSIYSILYNFCAMLSFVQRRSIARVRSPHVQKKTTRKKLKHSVYRKISISMFLGECARAQRIDATTTNIVVVIIMILSYILFILLFSEKSEQRNKRNII